MKGDGNLYHSLQKFFILGRRSPPDIFQNFMRLEKSGAVE